jgi:hypothetical protein
MEIELNKNRGGRFIDITGKRFGRLVVREVATPKSVKPVKWLCDCDCGNSSVVASQELREGHTISCGCWVHEFVRANHIHGKSRTRIYWVWNAMVNRCNNRKVKQYSDYGGRGIRVCQRWLQFANFYADMGDPPTKKHTLDR